MPGFIKPLPRWKRGDVLEADRLAMMVDTINQMAAMLMSLPTQGRFNVIRSHNRLIQREQYVNEPVLYEIMDVQSDEADGTKVYGAKRVVFDFGDDEYTTQGEPDENQETIYDPIGGHADTELAEGDWVLTHFNRSSGRQEVLGGGGGGALKMVQFEFLQDMGTNETETRVNVVDWINGEEPATFPDGESSDNFRVHNSYGMFVGEEGKKGRAHFAGQDVDGYDLYEIFIAECVDDTDESEPSAPMMGV